MKEVYKFKQNYNKQKYILSLFIIFLFISGGYLFILKETNLDIYRKDFTKLVYENLSIQTSSEVENVYVEPIYYVNESSKIQTPVNSGNKTIIIRMDDIAAYQYRGTSEKLVQDIFDRNMSITIAVIPNRVYQLHKDEELVAWLNIMKNNPRFEIALHGNEHLAEEFKTLNYEEASESIKAGNKEILETLGVVPVTFIPPSNKYSWESLEASQDLGYKVFSGDKDEYFLFKYSDYISLGYTTKTYGKRYSKKVGRAG